MRLAERGQADHVELPSFDLLIEQGHVALKGLGFSAQGGSLARLSVRSPTARGWLQITVQHLLEHSAGGWANDNADPMFQQPSSSQTDLISWTLDNVAALPQTPGTNYAYSNFGYCLLGRIIEAV